jgi:MFS family permease
MYSRTYKRYVTGVLLVVYIFNQTDRAIFGFLMEPIKRELNLSDTQLGFLAGPALVLLYAVLGIPIARYADRSQRVNIMSIATALWSGIVMLSAAVGNFWQLALTRVGVGIGEAGFAAIAQSVLAACHSAAERTRALSIFMLALPLGAASSSLMGGWINQAYGWRMAFVAAGLPGVVLALLLKTTVREPVQVSRSSEEASVVPPLLGIARGLWNRAALRHLVIAMTLFNLVTAAVQGWLAAFFIRSHGMQTGELGTWMAVATAGGASLGAWCATLLFGRPWTTDTRAQARILAAGTAFLCVLLIVALLSPVKRVALVTVFPAYVMKGFLLGPMWSLLQGLVEANTRATVSAMVIFAQTLLAGVVGLQLVGVLSDALVPRLRTGEALRWALVTVSLAALWAAAHFWLSARTVHEDSLDAA